MFSQTLQRSAYRQFHSNVMTHAPETGTHQKTGVDFWHRFFTSVAKFLAPETNMDE